MIACEDGLCRDRCHQFDGCPLSKPFHCKNRECASSESECGKQKGGSGYSRRLLQDEEEVEPSACTSNCLSEVKALLMQYTVDSSLTTEFAIAIHPTKNVPVAWITVPSGAVVATGVPAIQVRPVADSVMLDAENAVHPSRQGEFAAQMTYAETLLSVAFECVVDETVDFPFSLDLVYRAEIDATRMPDTTLPFPDVCLAYLYRIDSLGYARWACVDGSDADRVANPPASTDSSNPYMVTGKVPDCGQAGEGKIYGFIHSPITKFADTKSFELSWAQRNVLSVLLIFLSLGILGVLAFYWISRLFRYKKKFEKEKEAVAIKKDEVEEMQQFGGTAGAKDDEVEMTANPLVIQMKDMERRMNENQIKIQQEEAENQKLESEARQDHIQKLNDDRSKLATDLAALKAELAKQKSAPVSKPQIVDMEAPPTTASAASKKVTQTTTSKNVFSAKQPRKQKKKDF